MESNDRSVARPERHIVDELNFIELVRVLAEYRFVILGTTVAALAIAILAAFITTPIYRGEVIISPADESAAAGGGLSSIFSSLGGIPGLGSLSRMGRRDQMMEGIVTLTSPRFTMEFIEDKNLLPLIFVGKWNAELEEWDVDSPEEVPTLLDGHLVFTKKILQVVEEDTGVVKLTVDWRNPVQAAAWANELVSRLNAKMRKQAIDEANKTIDFLNVEVEKTRIVELQQAIYYMIESQINIRTMANIREEYSFKVISPAIAPEADQFVEPQRFFMIGLALVLGPALGIFLSFLIFAIKRIRSELSATPG